MKQTFAGLSKPSAMPARIALALALAACLSAAGILQFRVAAQNACPGQYTVREGESWSVIANASGVRLTDLLTANGDLYAERGNFISPGDCISIPGQEDVQLAQLANSTYLSDYSDTGRVTLNQGIYVGEVTSVTVSSGAVLSGTVPSRTLASGTVTIILIEPAGYGDLNGDGEDDAAVVLVSQLDNDQRRQYSLHAMLASESVYNHAASIEIGDRTPISDVRVTDAGSIILETVRLGPGDTLDAPSEPVTYTYSLQANLLVLTAENGAPVGAGGPPGQAGPCDVLSPEAFEATPTDALAFIRCGQTDLVLQQLEATDALSGTTTSRLAIEEQGIFISDEVFTVGSGEIDLDMSTAGEGERYFGILALLKREIAAGQYLLFLSEKDEWRFYGQVGLPADSLRRPAVSVVRAGEDAWLAITSDGSSSGANWRNIRWFDLRSDALEEAVFSYQTEIGGTYDGGLILVTASGRPHLSSTEEGERVITLNYSIEQNAPGLGIPIFSERAALYNRDPETGVFLFDAEQSDVTEEDLENGFSQKSQSDFLAFAEEEIANAINLGGVTTRTNIREYLEEIEDESDARTALLEILDATE